MTRLIYEYVYKSIFLSLYHINVNDRRKNKMLTLTTAEDPGAAATGFGMQFIIIILLILINAFFAASELAILSSNPYKLDLLVQKTIKEQDW